MRVAVTGANGFVGGHTVRHLLEAGHEVMAFGRRPEPVIPRQARLRYTRWDIGHGPIDVSRVDAVVHCAGSVTEWGSAADFEVANVRGTANVLGSFRRASVFVHLSTASVYDLRRPKRSVDEDSPPATGFVSDYSRSKIAAEELVRQRPGHSVILRPHIVYGPGEAKILPRLLGAIRRGPVLVPGNGRNRLSVTHVDNLVQAIELSLRRSNGHEIFNVADGITASVDDLLRAVQAAFGLERPIHHVPVAAAWFAARVSEGLHRSLLKARTPTLTRFLVAQLAHDFVLDLGRARTVLEYRPVRSYTEAFEEMAAAHAAAPQTGAVTTPSW